MQNIYKIAVYIFSYLCFVLFSVKLLQDSFDYLHPFNVFAAE